MAGYEIDPCEKCEEWMQPYLDRALERRRAAWRPSGTSPAAPTARKRYRFEESLRRFVRKCCASRCRPS